MLRVAKYLTNRGKTKSPVIITASRYAYTTIKSKWKEKPRKKWYFQLEYDVHESVPFAMLLKNFLKWPLMLLRNMLIAVWTELSETTVPHDGLVLSSGMKLMGSTKRSHRIGERKLSEISTSGHIAWEEDDTNLAIRNSNQRYIVLISQ